MAKENDSAQDRELLSELVNGNGIAFEILYRKYYVNMVNYALSYLGNIMESEDVVQNIFINIWNNRRKLTVEYSVKAYLFTAVKRASLNILKHRAIERFHSPLLVRFFEELSGEDYSEEEFEQIERIRKAIDRLPPKCRKIFMMSTLEGYKYREIADHLDISINTVRSHILKAYRIIREYLSILLPFLFVIP